MPDFPVVEGVAVVAGATVVFWVLLDTFETLLATNLRGGRLSLTRAYYRWLWKGYRACCVRIRRDDHRERWLARFGPASFLGLLVVWVLLEIFGWGLIWWGLRSGFGVELDSFGDAWYYAGVVYFSVGFGDILPATGLLRFLTILGALSGLGTLGLVIGFLPSLSAAYSARERQLLLLDDLGDQRITPVSLVRAQIGPDRDLARLESMFEEWASWCAEVYDSHTSLPMLTWFRSKHRGNSWITGLGVVADAAIAYAAAIPGAEQGAAIRLHRQAVRLVNGLGERVGLEPSPDWEPLPRTWWEVGHGLLADTGIEVRPFDDSLERLRAMQQEFHPMMEAFIEELFAPRGFWGPTSADHLAAASIDDLLGDRVTDV